MRKNKRLLSGTAAFLLAAVLLSMQFACKAVSSLDVARDAMSDALERLGCTLEEAIAVSTQEESDAAELSALDNCCIIGHSHAVGMQMALDVEGLDYIAEVGMITKNMLTHYDFDLPDGRVGGLRQGLEAREYERIFVLLGSNDIVGSAAYLPVFKSSMESLLDAVAEWQPDAEICLLSIAPLGKGFLEYCYYSYGLTQEIMDDYNYTLRSIAVSRGYDYLDITTPLSNEAGFLAKEFDRGDGLHFNADGNRMILDTILTHMGA